MKKAGWIDPELLRDFAGEGTDAHRLGTASDGWVERFAGDLMISYRHEPARERLAHELQEWLDATGFAPERIFARFLPKRNEERERPQLLSGDESTARQTVASERGLKYGIDFEAGYSVGLFIDQRENRQFVRQTRPGTVLNCFAYTCSFSVAAAAAGARTVNIDLSKKSLQRGQENFSLNHLQTGAHKFLADDVLGVLPRLARKGEKFDMIILDPPTFSRSHRGKAFHVEKDFEALLAVALELAAPAGRILLSTNYTGLREKDLEGMARYCLKVARRAGTFHRSPALPDFPPGAGASTIWLTLR